MRSCSGISGWASIISKPWEVIFTFSAAIYFINKDGDELGDPIMGAKNYDEFMFIIEEMKERFSK